MSPLFIVSALLQCNMCVDIELWMKMKYFCLYLLYFLFQHKVEKPIIRLDGCDQDEPHQ